MTRGTGVYFPDEMRLGLLGQVRRVLALRGVKVIQRVQLVYEWSYLLLAVESIAGTICWRWVERMNAAHLLPVLEEWALPCVVWDGAPAYGAKVMQDLKTMRVRQPAYSPEVNPAERVFEEVRRWSEGKGYADVEAKQAAAEVYLRQLAADPERVRQLCGWEWMRQTLQALPAAPEAPS